MSGGQNDTARTFSAGEVTTENWNAYPLPGSTAPTAPPAAFDYLCTARKGYDGPTGLGTPDGTGAF